MILSKDSIGALIGLYSPFLKLGNAGSIYYDPDTTILTEDVPYVQGDIAA